MKAINVTTWLSQRKHGRFLLGRQSIWMLQTAEVFLDEESVLAGSCGPSPSPCSSPVNLILEPPAPSPLHLLKRGSCPRCLALEELNSSSGRPESNHRFVYLDSCFENSKSQENQCSSRGSPHRPPIHLHRAQPFILTSTLDPAWV